MFDDKKPIATVPIAPQPPVEDMFGDVERPSEVVEQPMVTDSRPQTTSYNLQPRFGFLKVIFVVIVIMGLVGGAAYAAYRIMVQRPVAEIASDGSSQDNHAASSVGDGLVPPLEQTAPPEDKGTFLDSDGDGLTNAEELEAGTSITKADTDSDGLGDREEVQVYDTNPRKADTDGDTFLDGQEVSGGYNPNGEGKLFSVPVN